MESLKIILFAIAAAVSYGVLHDQITARICVEYFTIGHPPVFHTDNPTLLGLGWGVIATWWVGLIVGILLACSARLGSWPKRNMRSLVRPLSGLLLTTGGIAVVAGVVGWIAARSGAVILVDPIAARVPQDRHIAFIADLWAHSASYASAAIGAIILSISVFRRRRRESHRVAGMAI